MSRRPAAAGANRTNAAVSILLFLTFPIVAKALAVFHHAVKITGASAKHGTRLILVAFCGAGVTNNVSKNDPRFYKNEKQNQQKRKLFQNTHALGRNLFPSKRHVPN